MKFGMLNAELAFGGNNSAFSIQHSELFLTFAVPKEDIIILNN